MNIEEIGRAIGPMFGICASEGGRALDVLGLDASAKVLDVGTGNGNFAIYLASQGFEVLTGEPSTDTSTYAGKDWEHNARLAGVRERIRFQAFDASDMSFAEAAFDAVCFFGVLHHIDEAKRAAVCREALRVVKPGGAVVFFEPTPAMLEKIWVDDPTHPLAADPAVYMKPLAVDEVRVQGDFMDIFIYRNAG